MYPISKRLACYAWSFFSGRTGLGLSSRLESIAKPQACSTEIAGSPKIAGASQFQSHLTGKAIITDRMPEIRIAARATPIFVAISKLGLFISSCLFFKVIIYSISSIGSNPVRVPSGV